MLKEMTPQAIQDLAGNDADAFYQDTWPYTGGIVTAPNLNRAQAISDDTVILAYDADLDWTPGHKPSLNQFTVTANGLPVGVTGIVPWISSTGVQALSLQLGSSVSFTSTTVNSNVTDLSISVAGSTTAAPPVMPVVSTLQGTGSVTEVATVTFGALYAGQSLTVGGRTLTATAPYRLPKLPQRLLQAARCRQGAV